MRNKLILIIFGLSICGLFANSDNPNSPTSKTEELKVLAWNVWHRGHKAKYGQKACNGTIGIIKSTQADVILMIETYGCSEDIAAELGYHYKLLSDNLSIYSRYPITNTYTYPSVIRTFNFGGVEIDMNGKKIRLLNTWLDYRPSCTQVPLTKTPTEILAWDDAGTRDNEILKILTAIRPLLDEADSIPIIMGGDFNSHSHLDWTSATKDMYNHGGHIINWTVSNKMIEAGFKDSFREINPDPAITIGTTWSYPDAGDNTGITNRFDRIDYIYYQGKDLKATSSETHYQKLGETLTLNDTDFFYGSDHGFVLSTFEVTF